VRPIELLTSVVQSWRSEVDLDPERGHDPPENGGADSRCVASLDPPNRGLGGVRPPSKFALRPSKRVPHLAHNSVDAGRKWSDSIGHVRS
jgi:hypothetical protein